VLEVYTHLLQSPTYNISIPDSDSNSNLDADPNPIPDADSNLHRETVNTAKQFRAADGIRF